MESHSQSVTLPVCLTLFICWESFIHICLCVYVGGCQSNSISMADVDLLFCLSVCFGRASVKVNRLLGAEWGPSIQRQTHRHFFSATDWGVPPSRPHSLTAPKASLTPESRYIHAGSQTSWIQPDCSAVEDGLIIWIHTVSTCWKLHLVETGGLHVHLPNRNCPTLSWLVLLHLYCFHLSSFMAINHSGISFLLVFSWERLQNVAVVWH